jgi:hypothetical protein
VLWRLATIPLDRSLKTNISELMSLDTSYRWHFSCVWGFYRGAGTMVSAGSAFLLNSFNPGIFFVEKFLLSLTSFVTYIVDIDLSYIAAIFL